MPRPTQGKLLFPPQLMTILASVGIALGPSRNRGQGQQGPLVGQGHSHILGYGMSGHFNARNSVFELIGLLVADSSTAPR